MTPERFAQLSERYAKLRIAVVGDFCLDRYLDIDPAKSETSIETGLPVHNVTGVRSQPGAGGTILANLVALGVGTVLPVGFCGEDGEGFELLRTLRNTPRVKLDGFIQTPDRRTFSYTKPLVHEPGQTPRELSRLDLKNWTPTPARVEEQLLAALHSITADADAVIVMDQVDIAETGVVTQRIREAVGEISHVRPTLPVLADCRRGLAGWPACIWKMNARELSLLAGVSESDDEAMRNATGQLARSNHRAVFVTMAGDGILGAGDLGTTARVPTFPIRGPIDIVGAGDSVSANLTMALAAGGTISEAMEIAMAAASIVIHQVGTTGTATLPEIGRLLLGA
ncbi:MAG: PfkB family carbohydrate kinase [Chthoniobacteraceae bacterium]